MRCNERWNRKGRPVARTAFDTIFPEREDYILFVVVVDVVLVVMVSFETIAPSFAIAPSVDVIVSLVVIVSVEFRSVTIVLSVVVVSVFGVHAEMAIAATAIIEPAATLEMNARIGKLPR
ncbi:MAG: hypothetical protein ACJAWY_003321 [Sphingomonas echinoides]|jgi:hypothetical protein